MATLLPNGKQAFVDANGAPLVSGTVSFYVPGTLTPKDTYQDSGGAILNTNPVTLDGAGRALIYGTGAYRQVVRDSAGNLVWDQNTSDTSSTISSWAGTSGGTANAQTVAAPNFTSADGQTISFIAGVTNTGPLSINPNGAGPINVLNDLSSGAASLTGGEVVAGNAVTLTYSTQSGAFHALFPPAGNPVGTILEYAGSTAPAGYLLANGQAVSRTTYATLFLVIGTTFGIGDGATTFNVPDRGGRVGVGRDTSGRVSSITALASVGGVGGEQQHTLTVAELPASPPSGSVNVTYPAHGYVRTDPQSATLNPGGSSVNTVGSQYSTQTTPPNAVTHTLSLNNLGSGNAHNVVQPSIAMNYIIKY